MAGARQAVFDVTWNTTVQTNASQDQFSRLSSTEQLGSLGLVPFGFLIGGLLEATVGASATLLGGGLFLLATATMVLVAPSVRSLGATPAPGSRRAAGTSVGPDLALAIPSAPDGTRA